MAEELDKETQKLTNFARKFQESLAESGDLSSKLLQTFKDINGILDKNTKSVTRMESFQKEILSDARARAMIEEQVHANIASAEREMLKLKLAQIDLNGVSESYLRNQTKINEKTDLLKKYQGELEDATRATARAEADKTEILQRQAKIQANIVEKQYALNKVNGSIKINEDAIAENTKQQQSLKEKLKAVEEEMNEAQLQAIHDGADLAEEYNSMMAKRQFFLDRISKLEAKGLSYMADAERMGYRKNALTVEMLNMQDSMTEVANDLLSIDNRLLETKEKQRKSTKEISDLEESLSELMQEKASLEERMLNSKDGEIAAKIKELELEIKRNQQAAKAAKLQAGFLAYMKDTAGSSGGVLGNLAGMANQVKEMANKFKTIPAQFLLLHALIKEGLDLFVKLDKAAENFRKETGFTTTQMSALRRDAEVINREFQYMGVGIEEVYKSAKALTDVFGRTTLLTKETLTNVSLLAANLGVAEKDSADVLANFQGLGGATEKAAMNVIKVGAGISESAGVPFKLVMNDIANASADTLNLVGATPSKLMKSAIAARALGTDINKIASTQQKLLNYSSSITSELEASALLGRSISFQKARQLAYDGDAIGAAKATLDTIKKAGDFNKMTVYQKKALAEASGMELKDITKMLAVEKQRDAILLNGTDEQKKKLLAQEAELENLKKMADLESEDLVKQNEKAIMQQKMQGLVTQMTNLLQSVVLELGSALEPIIRIGAALLVPVLKMITGFIKGFLSPITKFTEKLAGGAETGDKFAKTLAKAAPIIEKMVYGAEKLGEGVAIFYMYFYKAQLVGSVIVVSFTKILSVLTKTSSIVTRIQSGFTAIMSMISASKGVTMLSNAVASIGGVFSKIVGFIQPIAGFFGTIFSKIAAFIKPITSIFGIATKTTGVISKVMAILGAGISTFLRYAGPVGMVISAIQFAVEYISDLIDIWSSEDLSIGDKILKSIAAIPTALYNVLVKPLVGIVDWLMEKMGLSFNLSDVFSALYDSFIDLGSKMIQPFVNSIYEIWEAVVNIFDGKEIGKNILNGLLSTGKLILQALLWPFTAVWGYLYNTFIANSPSELGLMIVDGIKSIGSMLFDALTFPFRTVFNFVSGLFGGDGDLGNSIVDGIKNAAGFIFDVLTFPFRTVMSFVSNLFEGGGEFIPKLLDGIKSAASTIFDVLTYPFKNILNFISGIFGGDGQLGTTIIEGIKNVASLLFDILTTPFKKALDFVKGLPLVGKLFGGADDISKQASPAPSIQSSQTSNVIEVNHLDELRDVVMELTTAVANLGTSVTTTPVAGTKLDTSGLEAKLDNLTQLLVGGAVRVYLDGKDVSAAMSSTGR